MLRFQFRLAAIVFLSMGLGFAAPVSSGPLSGYTSKQWQSSDGLPEQTVQAFAQSSDGYLWIGTSGGLLRFDGAHFAEYSRENTAAFAENSVFCLTAGRDGVLWIGTEGGGLIRLSHGTFRLFSGEDGLLDGFIRSVIEDRNGRIWIGTDSGLFKLANSSAEKVTRVDGTAGFPPIAVHALFQDRAGRVWVGGSRLINLNADTGEVLSEYKLPGRYGENRVKSILETKNGTVFVGTVSGLQQLSPGSRAFTMLPGIRGTVRVLRQTSDGTLWIGTIGRGAYTYRGGTIASVVPYQPLPSSTVLAILEDTTNNVWVGTEAGMVRLSKTPVSLIPLPDPSDFETISADSNGSLWVASTKLFHVVHGVATPFEFPELHGARVRNVFRDRNGSLWIGTDGMGLFHLCSGRTQQYTTANGMSNNFVRSVMQARNGDLWIATDEGLNRISRGVLRAFGMRDGLSYFSVRTIVEGADGDIWVGTDRGLSRLRQGVFQHDATTDSLLKQKVWAIHSSADGEMWFGTRNRGLYWYASGKMHHFTEDEGLAANSIYSILEDRHRRLWIGSPEGVSRVERSEFSDVRDYTKQHLSQQFYSHSDAGEIGPLYGGTQPAGAITDDGDVWFPTNKGLIRIVNSRERATPLARLRIDQVTVDGTRVSAESQLTLSSGNANLEISYDPILLGSQADLRFEYKLEGFDRDWVYASSRRVAYYTNLPAGKYRFRVRLLSATGSVETSEASMAITKRPYFYRTPWFFGICLVFVALVVWSAHRSRVKRMHIAFDAMLEERARLAREMHDTLIQGCASVSVLLEACSNAELSNREEQAEIIDYARTQLASSIDEARQAVWNLRGERTSDLGAEMRKLADRVSRESNLAVTCEIEGPGFPVRPSAMHELLMISREALYNATLHASPTELKLRIIYGVRGLSLEVHDDGCGFDQSQVSGEHYGLLGITERVRQLGGTLQVSSVAASGTGISVVIPRSAADAEEVVI